MKISNTLTAYLARQFLGWLLAAVGLIAAVILLFDSLELMRRAASRPAMTLEVVGEMALLRLPSLTQTVLPICVLFGAIAAFWRLTRSRELVVARASGVSVWQFLAPALALALLVGILKVVLIGPVASFLLAKAERLERDHSPAVRGQVAVGSSGVWFGESDGTGHVLVHAGGVLPEHAALTGVTLFRFGADDRFVERIDAPRIRLTEGGWEIEDAAVTGPNGTTIRHARLRLATGLSWREIEESGAAPDTLSVWHLPTFIGALERAGFSAVRHRLHLQALVASPLLLCGLVLVAAAFALHPGRRLHPARLLALGAATGLGLFVASDLVLALGATGRVPVVLAAWAPAMVCLAVGTASLLHVEEG